MSSAPQEPVPRTSSRGREFAGNSARLVGFCAVLVGGGAIGYWSWGRMHLVAIDVCGIGVGVSGRIGINLVGLLWLGCSVVLGGAAGAGLVYGSTRRMRLFGAGMLALLLGGTLALQLWNASSFESYCGGRDWGPPGR